MKYIRYRFKTESVDDPRPLIDMSKINMPWWCTGYATDNTCRKIMTKAFISTGTMLSTSRRKRLTRLFILTDSQSRIGLIER